MQQRQGWKFTEMTIFPEIKEYRYKPYVYLKVSGNHVDSTLDFQI